MKCDKFTTPVKIEIPGLGTIESEDLLLKVEVDEAIAELKDKIQQKDFFWEGCGFAKMGFKNTIAVYEYLDNLNAEKRKLKRALWLARAISAINAVGAIHNVIVCMQERNPKMSLSNIEAQKQVWKNVARKCRAMAEKFK